MATDFSKYQAKTQPQTTGTDFTKYGSVTEVQTPEKEPGYFGRVLDSFGNLGQQVTGAIQQGAQTYQQGVEKGTFGGTLEATGGLSRSALRTTGAVAEGAAAPIMEAPFIKPLTERVVSRTLEIPGAKELVSKATSVATKYPNVAKDIQNIIDIATLGGGSAAEKPLIQEGKAIASDIAQGAKVLLTPSEEAVQKNVVSLFNKAIKPTAKKTIGQADKFDTSIVNALRTIKSNVDNLNIEDATGELITGRAPQSIPELSQALEQTKDTVFKQYDALAKQAGGMGAVIDTKPISEEVLKVAQNKALQLSNPEVVSYAENWAQRLQGFGQLDTETTQEVIKLMNNNLQSFYKNPSYETASKVAVDAGIANNFRKALDTAIEGATGKEYQALKNQYSALKAIENDVVRASLREGRKNVKGLLDYSDMFTSAEMLLGITSLSPAMFTKGAIERGFKEYIKFLNDPNRAIKNIFEKLDTGASEAFTPTSATGKYLKNPKLGMSIEDVSKSNPLLQEAKKYKSAEEFVKAQGTPLYHGGAGVDEISKTVKILTPEEKLKYPSSGGGYVGLSTSPDIKYAKQFSRNIAGTDNVAEIYLDKNAKIFNLPKNKAIDDMSAGELSKLSTKYDAIRSVNDNEVRLLTDNVRTKQQLQSIWEKANPEVSKLKEKIDELDGQIAELRYYDSPEDNALFDDLIHERDILKSQLTDIWNKANKK